jgi:membrane protease YdiL (CAAX protease family)
MKGNAAARRLPNRLAGAAWAVILGIIVAMLGQGVWSALIAANLMTTPAIPWSVALMAAVLWLIWEYLGGRWWPASTSDSRRLRLRANAVPMPVFGWAVLAGGFSIVALAGWWLSISRFVMISGSVLPDMSKYPWPTTVLAIAMGSIVSPVLEQAGFWGYCQVMLEREFSGPVAIATTSILFALLPHPPMHVVLWPKLVMFFFTGATFAVMAYLTRSILPGLVVHILGLFAFFTLVFRDEGPPLTVAGNMDVWLWIHAAQMVAFGALAVLAFARLKRLTEPSRAAS